MRNKTYFELLVDFFRKYEKHLTENNLMWVRVEILDETNASVIAYKNFHNVELKNGDTLNFTINLGAL